MDFSPIDGFPQGRCVGCFCLYNRGGSLHRATTVSPDDATTPFGGNPPTTRIRSLDPQSLW